MLALPTEDRLDLGHRQPLLKSFSLCPITTQRHETLRRGGASSLWTIAENESLSSARRYPKTKAAEGVIPHIISVQAGGRGIGRPLREFGTPMLRHENFRNAAGDQKVTSRREIREIAGIPYVLLLRDV
jgi:hypothetical protein